MTCPGLLTRLCATVLSLATGPARSVSVPALERIAISLVGGEMRELRVLGTVWDESHLGFSVCSAKLMQLNSQTLSGLVMLPMRPDLCSWRGHNSCHLGVPFNTHCGPSPHLPVYQIPLSCAPDLGWPRHLPSDRLDPWQHPRSLLSSLSVPSPVLLP